MSASPELGGKCRACEAIGASWRTQVRTFKSCTLCLDSSLFPVLFHNDIPDRFFWPFKNNGQVLIPFCKRLFFGSAHTCPFRRLRRHLSQGKASHPLLQRRSAPRKAVRLLPDKRGQLTFPILFFMYSFSIRISWQSNSLLPSFLSGGQKRNDDRRKKHNMTLSEESGRGYR